MAGGMRPAVPFAKADQMRIRALAFEESGVPPAGRVIFWSGARVLSHGDVSRLGEHRYIPDRTDRISVAAADIADVKAWANGR